MIKWKAHSQKQEQAIFTSAKITLLATGIQFGKTTAGAWWLKRLLHTHTDPSDAFIVCSPTYKILEQSTLPPFLKIMEGWGDFNRSRSEFTMFNGGRVYFRTNTDPDSIVGITNVRAIWGDEAGKYTLYFWENIQGRASFKQCPILLTTSPYSLNWVYKDLIRPQLKGVRTDVEIIKAASHENPYFPKEEFERKKATMDSRRFNMMYGGEWTKMEGLVYDCWDDENNVVEPFQLPVGTRYVAGVDWGYTDPFVVLVRAITPDGRHYGVSEFYKTYTTIQDQVNICKQLAQVWGIKMFYCDPSQPGSIQEFNRAGLVSMAADNDIRKGIDLHYQLTKERRYKEFKGRMPHTTDEREQYHYPDPKDLRPDQDHKETVPVDQNNHTMDAMRYITAMTYRVHEQKRPMVIRDGEKKLHEMGQMERLEHLKKTHKRNRTYESWE